MAIPYTDAQLADAIANYHDLPLSPNFRLFELIKTSQIERWNVDNYPKDPQIIRDLWAVTNAILQPAREFFARPIRPSSGYRSPMVNQLVGGAAKSQHLLGQAVDFEINGLENIALARWVLDSLDFDQLILEYTVAGVVNSGWVHCSYRAGPGLNRRQVLTVRKGGQTLQGLVP